ncbi:MAG: hypothetical protein QM731_01720 [Chitinophagaceae bacterium]
MSRIIKAASFIIYLLLFACNDSSQEKLLNEREQALAEKENQFALKQQEYESLVKMRDSLLAAKNMDGNAKQWPAAIAGVWSSKLVCTASGCSEYVIGDQKTNESWNFTNDSVRTIVTVFSNNTLVRKFHGIYDTSAIRLHFKTDSITKRAVEMSVLLDQVSGESIKGTQTIVIDSTCTAKFSVELFRPRNN